MNAVAQVLPSYESFIFADGEDLKTTSLKVAEAFHKLHKNIIQKIETLECSKEFSELNFQPAEYIDEQGKPRPMYEMTKDGFMFLVMGFTGKTAAQIKESYIAAFNIMHRKLFAKAPPEQAPLHDLMGLPYPPNCRILATVKDGVTVKVEMIPSKCLIHTIDEFRSLVEMEHVIIKKALLKTSVTLGHLIQLVDLKHCAENAQVR